MQKTSKQIKSSQDIGKVLASARKAKGLSQREAAARLGVTQKWISNVEQGKSRAWIDKVLELAHFLGVRVFTEDDSEPRVPEDSQKTGEPTMEEVLRELEDG